MPTKIRYILLLAMVSVMIISCSKDKLDEDSLVCDEPISYEDVREIITNSCGYAPCHNGLGGLDNYNNFAGLESNLNSGLFSSRVLTTRDMPPSYAEGDENLTPPDPDPTSLTQEEIDLIRCWERNDFSEF